MIITFENNLRFICEFKFINLQSKNDNALNTAPRCGKDSVMNEVDIAILDILKSGCGIEWIYQKAMEIQCDSRISKTAVTPAHPPRN